MVFFGFSGEGSLGKIPVFAFSFRLLSGSVRQ